MTTDRLILIVLALGVWALVLQPTMLTASHGSSHKCSAIGYVGQGGAVRVTVGVNGAFGVLADPKVYHSVGCDY